MDRAHSSHLSRFLLLGVLLCGIPSWAGTLPSPPPLPGVSVEEQKYLKAIYANSNNVPHYTADPRGVRTGKPNDLIRATFGGTEYLCVNTGAGPGLTTTWKCVALGV